MVDKSLIGKDFTEFTYEVEKVKIREFARAIGDKNLLYYDVKAAREAGFEGLAMPPTFPTVLTNASGLMQLMIDKLGLNLVKILHGGQQYEYLKPIKTGETLTGKVKIANVFEKEGKAGKMEFYVMETTYTNQSGEKVFVDTATIIHRS
ncbi:MAG: MaoC family dehydratase N-terminal domain-containing protein [Pseudomonadota bacterium]